MSLCGACYNWKNGKCLMLGEDGYDFEDSLDCDWFGLSKEAEEILIQYKERLLNG